jgi:hypothetical protein
MPNGELKRLYGCQFQKSPTADVTETSSAINLTLIHPMVNLFNMMNLATVTSLFANRNLFWFSI